MDQFAKMVSPIRMKNERSKLKSNILRMCRSQEGRNPWEAEKDSGNEASKKKSALGLVSSNGTQKSRSLERDVMLKFMICSLFASCRELIQSEKEMNSL